MSGHVTQIIRNTLLLLTALLLTPLSAAGSEPHPLAVKALDGINAFDDAQWSYTKTTTSKEGVQVERHDATRPEGERWTLVSINRKEPTARELRTYRTEKAEEMKRRREQKNAEQDENEVDRGSIRLVDETPQRATFTFRTNVDGRMASTLKENILGTLVVNKDGAWAERFELESTGELKPIPGVKMEKFNLRMTFQRDVVSNEIVPEAIVMHVRGRAFLVKSLDEDRAIRYSEFEQAR